MADNPLISSITLPSGTTYDIKDAYAREQISTLTGSMTGAMHYLGVTTSNVTDGASINPVSISSTDVTAKAGDIVIKGNSEFIFSTVDNK
jgi:hypothetical protein